jgi:sarcosine oxidase
MDGVVPDVEVATDRGTYRGDRLLLTAGAWLPTLVPGLAPRVRVYRQVMFWFVPEEGRASFDPDHMPVYVRLSARPGGMFYGFPALDGRAGGMKIAAEQFERSSDPDETDVTVRPRKRRRCTRWPHPTSA